MEKIYIGIDPGSEGAIVAINHNRELISIMKTPKNGKEFDLQATCRFLEELVNISKDGTLIHAGLEDVHAVQGNVGGTSNFNFGRAKMMWEMGLMAYKIPHTLIQPQEWQKIAWEGVTKTMVPTNKKLKDGTFAKKVDTKTTSLTAVQRLFPSIDLRDPDRKTERASKPHDGVVDALLIAYSLQIKNL